MMSVLLAASLGLPQLAGPLPIVGTSSELELVALVGTTELALVNPTAEPALVRIATADGFHRVSLVVPARGDRTLEFPRRTLAGTTLELIAAGPGGPLTSGAFSVDRLIACGYRAVWIESVGRSLRAWGECPSGPEYLAPEPGTQPSLPPPPASPGPHVPVVNPPSKPRGDLPPKIQPAPPPPV